MLSEEFLYQLKANNDIAAVMESYVPLKKAGRDYVCSCPFHSEKTPSCHIYLGSQNFFCFGCGAGGDVINFIRRIENLEYMEAVRFLAQRAGMAMPEDDGDRDAKRRTRMLELNRAAARFFRDKLISPEGREGWEYIIDRGLTPNTIKKYGLGYAEDDWKTLVMHLRGMGFSDDEMVEAAVAVRGKTGSIYDKFRHRVMFPIIDRRGNIIGFGGRALEKDAMAKYLNSDETLVFKKRQNIFSLNFAKNTKEKFLILCEGYMDVIALNQAGFDSAIATLGTAITPEQARLMKQYADEVVISYDSDAAGQKATMKAINLLNDVGIIARVLQMEGAKDPDEYVKKFGADSFRMLIEKSGSAISFELSKIKAGLNIDSPEGRAEYLKKSVELIAGIGNRLDRTIYCSEVAKTCELTAQMVIDGVEQQIKKRGFYEKKDEEKKLIRAVPSHDKINPDADKYPNEAKAERGILSFIFHSPNLLPRILSKLTPEDFPTSFNRRLLETLILKLKNGQSIDTASLGNEFSPEEVGTIVGMQKENDILVYTTQRLDDYIKVLTDFKESANSKSVADMTFDELREYTEKLKQKAEEGRK